MERKIIEVVAGILLHNHKLLVCSRPKHTALGEFWEFPGGKVETGETHRQALIREIREELAADIVPGDIFWRMDHDYGDKYVRVSFFFAVPAEPVSFRIMPQDGQETRWISAEELCHIHFLPADEQVAAGLQFFLKNHPGFLQ